MKTILACFSLVVLLAGCRSTGWTKADLGEGEYSVSALCPCCENATNNPTISLYSCGRMQVETFPHDMKTRGDIWIDWLGGGLKGRIADTNGTILLNFEIEVDGTNVTVTTGD